MSNDEPSAMVPPRPRLTDTPRGQTIFISAWVLGTVIALSLWIGAFMLGQNTAEPTETLAQDVEPVDEAVPEFPLLGSSPQSPGVWDWLDLRGGECLTGFDDAFAQEFEVISCGASHDAELIHAELLSDDPGEPYPGDALVLAQAREICDVRDLVDIDVAREFSDLRTAYAYPVDATQWSAGERGVYCFVYSEGGDVLTQSLR